MHPAASVIFFTTLSGLGYGFIVALSLTFLFDLAELSPAMLALGLFAGMAIAAFGLSLSLFHLGHPERAWRALSQWRSSWLSREGVLAIAAFLPTFAACSMLFLQGENANPLLLQYLLMASILLSLGTVYATAMIYRSLRSIDAWFNPWVPYGYLSLALSSGFILASAFAASFGEAFHQLPKFALVLVALSASIKFFYWRSVRVDTPRSSIASALGMNSVEAAKPFVAPHTQQNYLMQEMGYQIARTHAAKLRTLCVAIGFVAVLGLLVLVVTAIQQFAAFFLWLAVVAAMFGIIIERWLFFAEAKHTVMRYYGR